MTLRVRTTISLSPEAYDVFKRMADAGNLSISRCMGDWLADTMDAAEMITLKMEDAKREPMRVVSELRAVVAGMVASADSDSSARQLRRMQDAQQRAAGVSAAPSPSSNTGVLVPSPTPKTVLNRAPKRKQA